MTRSLRKGAPAPKIIRKGEPPYDLHVRRERRVGSPRVKKPVFCKGGVRDEEASPNGVVPDGGARFSIRNVMVTHGGREACPNPHMNCSRRRDGEREIDNVK